MLACVGVGVRGIEMGVADRDVPVEVGRDGTARSAVPVRAVGDSGRGMGLARADGGCSDEAGDGDDERDATL